MSENKESSNTHDEDKKPVKDDALNLENIQVENELDEGQTDEDNASSIEESNEELQTKNLFIEVEKKKYPISIQSEPLKRTDFKNL